MPAIVTWPVPDGADIIAVACVPVAFGTADDCLFEFGHLQAGETVLIQAGAGGVGIAAIQLAKRAGATVIATASSDERLERLDGVRPRPRRRTTRTTTGSTRSARSPAGAASTSSSTRSAARSSPAASRASRTAGGASPSAAPDAIRSRSTRACSGMGNQSLTGVFLGAEIATPRAQAMIGAPRRRRRRRPPARRGRPHVSRSRRPPPPTPTSRAAKPSAASSSSPVPVERR